MNELDAWKYTGKRALRLARGNGPLQHRMVTGAVLAVAMGLIGTALILSSVRRNVPETYHYADDHFKYGSIGAEAGSGIPYWIWLVLPQLFPEYLPDRPGEGYARLGFVYESGTHVRPIGTSLREDLLPLVGLNCAVCHVGTIQDTPTAPVRHVLGMPAHQFNFEGYLQFLFACARDTRFTADTLLPAIQQVNPQFSWFDRLIYRLVVIPQTRAALLEQATKFSWKDKQPPWGPGRVDTFGPYKARFGYDMSADNTVGTVDLPSLWNQGMRRRMWLHWDGNNNAVEERNISAAIGSGATADSLDFPALNRVADWVWDLQPPSFPHERIDFSRVGAGSRIFRATCAECHAVTGPRVGQVVHINEVGTDPERLRAFTPALADQMNTLGTGRPWKFRHFRKTDGYANQPLDGIWLRAPYLHNGSVPTLRDLLKPPEQRPAVFYRGYSVYDYANVGFVTTGPQAERVGFRFDTQLRGNSNQGHTYGTDLRPDEVDDLIEYLKTL
ncbi:MAG TPA: cytochrome c [Chloroflexota bacterium]|nr:cytochrome c [Chloroflexota bacterium]